MKDKLVFFAFIFILMTFSCASGKPNAEPPPQPACVTSSDCQVTSCNNQQCVDGMCANQWRDEDQDGFADMMCGSGPEFNDCNDNNVNISPKALDTCDCEDNDCDGTKDNLCNFETKLLYPGMDAELGRGGVFGCYSDMPFRKIPNPSNENCQNATVPTHNTVFMNEVDENVLSATWYYGCDGKKYLFSFLGAFESWFGKGPGSCCVVRTITDEVFQSIPRGIMAGGKVCYRPGGKRILQTTLTSGAIWESLFVVSKGCVLRRLASEQVAEDIFGPDWKNLIEIMPWAH